MPEPRKISPLGTIEMSEEESEWFTAIEAQADRDAAAEHAEHRVNMRMAKQQVALIRRAAALYGVPYQSYIKQAAVRQAIEDLKRAGEVLAAHAVGEG
jgi:predicted DNA binding CopG/RHH family protein